MWFAHAKSPQPFAPFHPLVYYTLDFTNFEWYWQQMVFAPALGEYSSKQFGSDISKKFTIFLTMEYTSGGYRTVVLDPKDVSGATISFGGTLMNSQGLPILQDVTITANDKLPSCNASSFSAFQQQLDTLLAQLDTASSEEDVVSSKFAVDVAFFSEAYVGCSAQLDNLLNATYEETTLTTTQCVNDDPSSDSYKNDSCCSPKAAWSSVCHPREVRTQDISYTVDPSKLESCGSTKCSKSFLEDYINAPAENCEELSQAIQAYTVGKRIHFLDISLFTS
jgi:hypothetical protein